MSAEPERQPSLPGQEYSGPKVEATIGETVFTFTWGNTTVRRFFLEDGAYDHIALELPNGKTRAFSTTTLSMKALSELLISHNFTQHLMPVLDETTISWYVAHEAGEIDEYHIPPLT